MNRSNQSFPVLVSSVAALSLAIGLAGCGKGVQKLTSDQKAEFKKTLASLGDAMQAASMGGMGIAGPNSGGPDLGTQDESAPEMGWTGTTSAGTKKHSGMGTHTKLQHELIESIQQSKCTVNSSDKPNQLGMSSADRPMADVEISGSDCPIQFKLAAKQDGEWIQVQTAYKVRSEAYRALNDVDQVDAEFKIKRPKLDAKLDVSKRGAPREFLAQKQEIGMEYKVSFHSQKLGTIPLQMKMNMKPSRASATSASPFPFTGDLKLTASMPKYEVEMKAAFDEKGPKYTLNQEEIKSEEFQEILGAAQAGAPQGGNPFRPLEM